ncbi:hemolysin [Opitutaceae bacterium TAV4]|nr:hemolysin [Opitutaceae bacterium TAV4]RRJ98384.1 hemolysin [Opitutaceae bacterium TAV3]
MKTTRTHQLRNATLTSLLALAAVLPLAAQVSFTGTPYTQDFDSPALPYQSSGTPSWTFINNDTLLGWYSTENATDAARSSSGPRSAGTLYSFGANNSSDRALGLFAGNGYAADHTAYLGLQLINNTGAAINSVTISFDVEQWRYHTNATTWEFSYMTTGTPGNQLSLTTGYKPDARGDATSLHKTGDTGFATSGGLPDGGGNGEDNKYSISFTLTNLNWKAGDSLWLRWSSNQGNDAAGIGLDNFRLEVAQIPEPHVMALLMGASALALLAIKRKK